MGRGHRSDRLGEEIRKVISEMLITEIKDPRLQNSIVSISGVDVTRDGSYATCFVTVLVPSESGKGNDKEREEQEEVLAGLNSAKGLFKKQIGKQIKVRHIPELIFKIDTSMEYGRHIDEVLNSIK